MVYFRSVTLRFDGGCQPNPGEGGCGYEIIDDDDGNTILEGQHYIGYKCTNNVAEYKGLIEGLKRLRDSTHEVEHLNIEGDSELVINQLNGLYNVRSNRLRPLYNRARQLLDACIDRVFNSYIISHIDRYSNSRADELASDAVNEQQDWSTDNY